MVPEKMLRFSLLLVNMMKNCAHWIRVAQLPILQRGYADFTTLFLFVLFLVSSFGLISFSFFLFFGSFLCFPHFNYEEDVGDVSKIRKALF